MLRTRRTALAFALTATTLAGTIPRTSAADIVAAASGGWSTPLTWATGVAPGSADRAFIGSSSPAGGAATAVVNLTEDVTVNSVFVGNGAGRTGTLNLGDSLLTVGTLSLGASSGTGSVTRGTGRFTASSVQVAGANTLAFAAGDVTRDVGLSDGATATTSATGNVTGGVGVSGGGRLTLGAPLAVTGDVDLRGANTVLDAAGFPITAGTFRLSQFGAGARSCGQCGGVI